MFPVVPSVSLRPFLSPIHSFFGSRHNVGDLDRLSGRDFDWNARWCGDFNWYGRWCRSELLNQIQILVMGEDLV